MCAQRARGAATKIDCRWKEMPAADRGSMLFAAGRTRRGEHVLRELPQQRFAKPARLRAVEQFFVISAVRANLRAKRNVHLDGAKVFYRGRRVACMIRSSRHSCAVVIRSVGHKFVNVWRSS